MKPIENLNKFLGTDETGYQHVISDYDEIESLSQELRQQDNPRITLYRKGKQFFVHFDHGNQNEYFLLDGIYEIKKALEKPKKLLKDIVKIWILTSFHDNDTIILQMIIWGLRNVWDFQIENRETALRTRIIVTKYSDKQYVQIDYLRNENNRIIEFENGKAAYEMMCRLDDDSRRPDYNEYERPNYTIVGSRLAWQI